MTHLKTSKVSQHLLANNDCPEIIAMIYENCLLSRIGNKNTKHNSYSTYQIFKQISYGSKSEA